MTENMRAYAQAKKGVNMTEHMRAYLAKGNSDFVSAAALAMWSWTAAGGALGGGNERLLS